MNKLGILFGQTFLILMWAVRAHAGLLNIPQITPSQAESLFETINTDLVFRSVEPASSGNALFSLGATLIETSTSGISNIIGPDPSYIPAGDISAVLQLPWGFALEGGVFPNYTISGSSLSRYGGNLKWSFTKFFPKFPLDVALRGGMTSSHLTYSEDLSGGTIYLDYKSDLQTLMVTVSKRLLIFEPFVSYGWVSSNSTLDSTGTSSLFIGGANHTSTNSTVGSNWYQAGLKLRLVLLSLAAEYDRIYNTNSYAAKLAFNF